MCEFFEKGLLDKVFISIINLNLFNSVESINLEADFKSICKESLYLFLMVIQ